MIKFKGIKEAVKNFNSWEGRALIKLDVTTRDVWTEVYADSDDFTIDFFGEDVITILNKNSYNGTWNITSIDEVYNYTEEVYKKEVGRN